MQDDLRNWTGRARPGSRPMRGRSVLVEPILDSQRFEQLAEALTANQDGRIWRFLGHGPFADQAAFLEFAARTYLGSDSLFHAIVPVASGRAEGVAALMRIDENNGVVEIGQICLSPTLQRSRPATEAFFLIFQRVFNELGYRRLEWKCDRQNVPSRRAAERMGFEYEGTFRQHMVVKGRNRDTAWYALLDRNWPGLRKAFVLWLDDKNFDDEGRQRRPLADIRRR